MVCRARRHVAITSIFSRARLKAQSHCQFLAILSLLWYGNWTAVRQHYSLPVANAWHVICMGLRLMVRLPLAPSLAFASQNSLSRQEALQPAACRRVPTVTALPRARGRTRASPTYRADVAACYRAGATARCRAARASRGSHQ